VVVADAATGPLRADLDRRLRRCRAVSACSRRRPGPGRRLPRAPRLVGTPAGRLDQTRIDQLQPAAAAVSERRPGPCGPTTAGAAGWPAPFRSTGEPSPTASNSPTASAGRCSPRPAPAQRHHAPPASPGSSPSRPPRSACPCCVHPALARIDSLLACRWRHRGRLDAPGRVEVPRTPLRLVSALHADAMPIQDQIAKASSSNAAATRWFPPSALNARSTPRMRSLPAEQHAPKTRPTTDHGRWPTGVAAQACWPRTRPAGVAGRPARMRPPQRHHPHLHLGPIWGGQVAGLELWSAAHLGPPRHSAAATHGPSGGQPRSGAPPPPPWRHRQGPPAQPGSAAPPAPTPPAQCRPPPPVPAQGAQRRRVEPAQQPATVTHLPEPPWKA
jgi:hypothetical protein